VNTSSNTIAQMDGVTVKFKNFVALDNVSVSLGKGRIVGLVGPNGAGKTTLMRVLSALLIPVLGKASVLGYDVVKQPGNVRRNIGYLPDSSGLYPDMRVTEYLDFFSSAYGLNREASSAFRARALTLTGLEEKASSFVENLSLGMRAKLSFIKVLANDPALIILDEPLSGLDPMALSDMRNLLSSLRKEGRSIFISSHLLSNLEKICDDIVFLHQGKIIEDNMVDVKPRYLLRLAATGGASDIQTVAGVESASPGDDGLTVELTLTPAADPAEVLLALAEKKLRIVEWRPLIEGLDERLMRIVKKHREEKP
jgi:ABC-2 type transport system ATP-binding protein